MALLPRKVGSVTLMRALGSDGASETLTGILDQPAGKQVVVRKVMPALTRDPARLTSLRSRVGDLKPIRHPALLPVLDAFEEDGALYIVQDWIDAVSLAEVVAGCQESGEAMPHNVFLNLAVQICNGLEALHSQPGVSSGARHVLHLCVRPESIWLTRDGDVLLGDFGLVRSPTLAPHSSGIRMKTAYLSPEQTHQDHKLTPASDLFSLGAVLFEALAHKPMFHDSTPLKTIAQVRRAEVTTQLLEIKEILPGLDRVLYRALSLNQRHRYQRAFVLREDLRGLMAGYSFSNIQAEARAFLAPLFQGRTRAIDEVMPQLAPTSAPETTGSLLEDNLRGGGFDDDPTGSFEPGDTQPFQREANGRGPAANVGLGPSDLAELGFDGPIGTDSEELALLKPHGAMEPSLGSAVAGAAFAQSVVESELPVANPLVAEGTFPPPPAVQRPRFEPDAPEGTLDDDEWSHEEWSEEEWESSGPSGPFVAGALLVGVLGLVTVLCGGGSLLGAIGATQVATSTVSAPISPSATAPAVEGEGTAPATPPTPLAATDIEPAVLLTPLPSSEAVGQAGPDRLSANAAPAPRGRARATATNASGSLEPPADLGELSDAAFAGALSSDARAAIALIPEDDTRYSRSRVLLYQDAKARGDERQRRALMGDLMELEENTYRPELLVEEATLALADGDFTAALETADRAERYWSRLPSDLVFSRKAMIYEVQAVASWSLYTRSDPPREALLDGALDGWKRYHTHVSAAGRSELASHAEERIGHIEDVRSRMH